MEETKEVSNLGEDTQNSIYEPNAQPFTTSDLLRRFDPTDAFTILRATEYETDPNGHALLPDY
jgi:hypothetical protein